LWAKLSKFTHQVPNLQILGVSAYRLEIFNDLLKNTNHAERVGVLIIHGVFGISSSLRSVNVAFENEFLSLESDACVSVLVLEVARKLLLVEKVFGGQHVAHYNNLIVVFVAVNIHSDVIHFKEPCNEVASFGGMLATKSDAKFATCILTHFGYNCERGSLLLDAWKKIPFNFF
jgi:hypothetical protein